MKKLITLIAAAFLIGGCSTQKTGCDPNPKIRREIKFKGFVNPRQKQVKVIEVTNVWRNRADLTCISGKDTIFLRYGWRGIGTKIPLKIGTWLTVHYDSVACEPNTWVIAKIKINK
jgi:hypothetical protein